MKINLPTKKPSLEDQGRPLNINPTKQTIFWDVDDVVINSLEVTVDLINEWYNKPNNLPIKSVSEAKDWKLQAIHKGLTPEQIDYIFRCPEFWAKVQIREGFNNIIHSPILNKYNHVFVTKGTLDNLTYKECFLRTFLGEFYTDHFEYIGLLDHESKGTINMSGGIMIDDNMRNLLESNASIKILITNGIETCYNNAYGDFKVTPENLYIVNTLEDIQELLTFNSEHNLLNI